MPAKNSKSMKTCEHVIPVPENKSNESPPPQTTSIGRVIKKILKVREEDNGDGNIKPQKNVTEKRKSLEKIHSKSLDKGMAMGELSRLKDWMRALSPQVSFILLVYYQACPDVYIYLILNRQKQRCTCY